MIWKPMDLARLESAVIVFNSPEATTRIAQPNQSCGRYRLNTLTLNPVSIVIGAMLNAIPNRSTPDAVGEASLHAW
jgi:hypothetical protein